MMCGNAKTRSIINIFRCAARVNEPEVQEVCWVQLHVMQGATHNHNNCELE